MKHIHGKRRRKRRAREPQKGVMGEEPADDVSEDAPTSHTHRVIDE